MMVEVIRPDWRFKVGHRFDPGSAGVVDILLRRGIVRKVMDVMPRKRGRPRGSKSKYGTDDRTGQSG